MHTNIQSILHVYGRDITLGVLCGVVSFAMVQWDEGRKASSPTASVVTMITSVNKSAEHPSGNASSRRARRLQARAQRMFGNQYALPMLEQALRDRGELLKTAVSVQWKASDGAQFPTWIASVSAYPSWVRAEVSATSFAFVLSPEQITSLLSFNPPVGITAPKDSTITGVSLENGVYHAVTDGYAEPGYVIDIPVASAKLASLLAKSGSSAVLPLTYAQGRVINASSFDLGPLEYLTTGRSNFAGSGKGRIANVRKGFSQFIDNILIPPGEEFSFNKAVRNMDVPGIWEDALVIVNSKDLVYQPGGGICQVATTVYRAALLWGLPITQRANHSLFVTYYVKYGLGIDATIYPKRQDLTFINNTGHYLLLQAFAKEYEAFVSLYGKSDGRSVSLEGPYFQATAPQALIDMRSRPLQSNEIGWLQKIRSAEGSQQMNLILSRYMSIPRSVKEQYAQKPDGKI